MLRTEKTTEKAAEKAAATAAKKAEKAAAKAAAKEEANKKKAALKVRTLGKLTFLYPSPDTPAAMWFGVLFGLEATNMCSSVLTAVQWLPHILACYL